MFDNNNEETGRTEEEESPLPVIRRNDLARTFFVLIIALLPQRRGWRGDGRKAFGKVDLFLMLPENFTQLVCTGVADFSLLPISTAK